MPEPKPPPAPPLREEGGVTSDETPPPAETGMTEEADPGADRTPHREGGMIGEG